MLCPTDQTELKISERQGVEIDYCPQCRGVWLDRGELDKLVERSLGHATPPQLAAAAPAAPAHQQPYQQPYQQPHRKKRKESWLSELFD